MTEVYEAVKQIMFFVCIIFSIGHIIADVRKYSDDTPVDHFARSVANFAAAYVWLKLM